MNELAAINDSCYRCGVALLDSDNFCANCGLPTDAEAYPNVPAELVVSPTELAIVRSAPLIVVPPRPPSTVAQVLENRLFVIVILLCAGPIGLPALWFSPRFSRRTKIATTLGYMLVTAILPLAIAWYFLEVAVRPLVDVLGG